MPELYGRRIIVDVAGLVISEPRIHFETVPACAICGQRLTTEEREA